MVIEENKNKVLRILVEQKRDANGDAWISAAQLGEIMNLDAPALNDIASLLIQEEYAKSQKGWRTAPFNFAKLQATPKGRKYLESFGSSDRVKKWISWIRAHKIGSLLVFSGIIIIALSNFTNAIKNVYCNIIDCESNTKIGKIYPAVNTNIPMSSQIQLFATDKVIIHASSELKKVRFGGPWEDYVRGQEYIVFGTGDTPVEFEYLPKSYKGYLKIEVSFTRNHNKQRDIR